MSDDTTQTTAPNMRVSHTTPSVPLPLSQERGFVVRLLRAGRFEIAVSVPLVVAIAPPLKRLAVCHAGLRRSRVDATPVGPTEQRTVAWRAGAAWKLRACAALAPHDRLG